MPPNTFRVRPYTLADAAADQVASQVPRIVQPLVRGLAKHYAKRVYADAGLSAFTAVQVQVPQPVRRPHGPPPQAHGAGFNPYAQGMSGFQPYEEPPPPYRPDAAPHERYDPPPGPPPHHLAHPFAPPDHPPPPYSPPHAPPYAPPDHPPPGFAHPSRPQSTFQRPAPPPADIPWHLQPPPYDDPIGMELHARLNQIAASMQAASHEPEAHPAGPAHALDPREQRAIDHAIALSMQDATPGLRGIDPARVHEEQRSVAYALKGLRDIPSLETEITPWQDLDPDIRTAVYDDNETAYLEELSAGATRTDRIANVLAAHDMTLIPNGGKTQPMPRDGAPPADEKWATNNCLLISLMQHATGDYDSDHAPLVNQFREIIEQDPSLGIKSGDKLPAHGDTAKAIVSLINNSLGLERPLRMITVSDAAGAIHIETTGPDHTHRRDVIVVDMGGHFEAAAPVSVIAARREQDEAARRQSPDTLAQSDVTPAPSAPPPGAEGMHSIAHVQLQSTLIQQAQQLANTTMQGSKAIADLTKV